MCTLFWCLIEAELSQQLSVWAPPMQVVKSGILCHRLSQTIGFVMAQSDWVKFADGFQAVGDG